MHIFENDNYKIISSFVEKKIPILKDNIDFNKKYNELYEKIEKLELILDENNKTIFEEIMKLIYETEQYYFSLSYSLGVKYGEDLKKL